MKEKLRIVTLKAETFGQQILHKDIKEHVVICMHQREDVDR